MRRQGAGLAPIAKLGYIEVRSADPEALVAHYSDVLCFEVVERDTSGVYLGVGSDHHCVVVTEGEPHGRASLGLQLAGDIDEAERRLHEAGIAVERRSDPQPGINEDLLVGEPATGTPLALYPTMAQTGAATILGPRPTKLGHVASYTTDLKLAEVFYEDVLGFRWSDTIGDFFTFLRCNADHHAINIMESKKKSGLYHIAFEVRDIVHLKDALDQMARHGVRLNWGPGRHGPGHNIFTYHEDPDGNTIEFFTEIDVVLDEREPRWEPRPWHEEFPMGPRFWPLAPETPNVWGPINFEHLEH